jgi:hypothetical protein
MVIRADNIYASRIVNNAQGLDPKVFRPAETGLSFTNDDPLIRFHTHRHANLSIRGKANNVGQLLLDLARVHENLYAPYIKNLTATAQAIDVLLAGYGILASAPPDILGTYAEVLETNQVESHFKAELDKPGPQAIALLMDRGFVVSQYMWAEQVL